jgi:tRNA threonylcarbamoyladenosine modification (KEOPS) complex  Pcc1 subunit
MNNQNFYSIKSLIEINFKNSELCEISYNSFLPEFNNRRSLRSKIMIEKKEKSLTFQIESNDITAFRASVNDIINFGKIIDNTVRIIGKY